MVSRGPACVARFDAVILAGGRARRLGGVDKPGLTVGGRTLAEAVVSAVAGAEAVIVVGPERSDLRGTGAASPPRPLFRPGGTRRSPGDTPGPPVARTPPTLRFVLEDPPGGGPVTALRRGITEVSAPWLVLLAADLPFLLPEHVQALLAAAGEAQRAQSGQAQMAPGGQRAGAILADDGGRPQWLIGCWPTTALASALRGYDGRSLHGLLSPMRPVELVAEVAPGAPPPWLDCDSPADLRRAREWAAGGGSGG
jgi:molybdopterin-guanine dinucleotide biosynthesis protein A